MNIEQIEPEGALNKSKIGIIVTQGGFITLLISPDNLEILTKKEFSTESINELEYYKFDCPLVGAKYDIAMQVSAFAIKSKKEAKYLTKIDTEQIKFEFDNE